MPVHGIADQARDVPVAALEMVAAWQAEHERSRTAKLRAGGIGFGIADHADSGQVPQPLQLRQSRLVWAALDAQPRRCVEFERRLV